MKIFKIFLMAFLLFLLERLVFARIGIFSFAPWLGLSFCLVGAFHSVEGNTAVILAAVYGLVLDLTGGGGAGTAMFSFALSVWLIGIIGSKLFKNSLLSCLVLVFITGLFCECIYFSLNAKGLEISFSSMFSQLALPLAAIDTFVALLLYPVAKRLFAERRTV